MVHLLLLPLLIATLLQGVAAFGAVGEARRLGVEPLAVAVPIALYILAGLAGLAACALGGLRAPAALIVAVVAGVLMCAGPLAWGAATGQFTPSHHLTRLALVAVVLGLYAWHGWLVRA